jgi:type I restriction enzyme S subunit
MMQIPTPSGWQRTKVGLISKIKYGLGVPPKQLENGTPMLRATNVKRGRIATEGLMRIDASAIPGAKDAVLREGDIIVVRSGAYTGDSALVTGEWAGSIAGYDLVISPDQSVVPAFLALWMLGEGAQSHFRGHRERSAQPHLNRQQIAAAVIDLPPLAEQRQIARVLSAAQRAIERQERLIALTAELKNAIMRKLFTEGTLSGPQKQSSDIGPIPANWDVRPLSDLTAIPIVDGTHKTPTYRTDGIPFITAKDIVHNAVCLDECRFVSKDEHTLLTRRIKPQRGDILLTKVGTVGNVALVESDSRSAYSFNLRLFGLTPTF